MRITKHFLFQTLDTVKSNIAVVNNKFEIVYVNKSWIDFGIENGVCPSYEWLGENYVVSIEPSALDGDEFTMTLLHQFSKLASGDISEFELEYPCHSETEDRWFIMQISSFDSAMSRYFVISHQNITERVKLELESKRLARVDSLTGLANRRGFDEFLELEWKHCQRDGFPISIALIDVDDFKLINDNYGHQAGDDCLKKVSQILAKYSGRGSDLSARIGGDEFAVIWGNITNNQAAIMAKALHSEIDGLLFHDGKKIKDFDMKISVGLHSQIPKKNSTVTEFLAFADSKLYKAKSKGKNYVCV